MEHDGRIAIVGYAGAFPGAASPEDLWKLCSEGRCGLTDSPEAVYRSELPKRIYEAEGFVPVGGGPLDYRAFDAKFFGYAPKEARLLDPQIRKLLEASWHAMEHAGYNPCDVPGIVGAFVASSVNAYLHENLAEYFQHASEEERSQTLFVNEPDFL
ncbi:MAG: polyketide synthase type I, partial [Chlamydiia bacterium]|nr:polyketide synthase type I [Chlamydiia bacterium]